KLSLHESSLELSELPSVCSTIPILGHLLGLQRNSARYVNEVLTSTSASLFTIRIPFKTIVLAHPSMDRILSRHVADTGLAQILALVGRRVFGFGDDAVRAIASIDPRPLHRAEFGRPENLQRLTMQSSRFLWDEIARAPRESEVDLGHWMFRMTVSATACAVWGNENPWRMDDEFAESFMTLSESFESLSRPLPWITARKALAARNFLHTRLRAFHAEHRSARVQSVAHGINIMAHSDPDWESNADYYSIELVSALGLLATPSTLAVWLVRHLLAAPRELLDRVVKEALSLPAAADGRRLDISEVRTRCPWLVAAWYETLRLHMTGVPRLARHAFELPLQGSNRGLSLSQGDIILLPMCASNRDPRAWENPSAFTPARFVAPNGRLNTALMSRVRAFGVAGNLCPGREFGFNVAMAVVAGILRTFSIQSLDRPFVRPEVARGFNVGFERLRDDVRVLLVKR
ncbi:cytochrome P450, partial [Auricularia subglabra TFB-10046 SS5]